MTVCRELTKQFEATATMQAREFLLWLAADTQRTRGEFVLVLHGLEAETTSSPLPDDARRTLHLLLDELPLKQAVALAAQICGAPRNAVYEAALALRRDPDTDPGEAPELPRT